MSYRRVSPPTPPAPRPGPRGTRTGAARPRIVGGDDLALPVVAVAVELAGSHHPAERGASPQPIALRRPRLEAHEKSPGRRNREGAEKVREDHQGDKAPPARRPTRKHHNHSSNLWYDCASKRPNGTQFTFLGRFFCCFPWLSFSSQHLSAEITSYFIEKEGGARQSAAFLESLVMPRIRRSRRARRRPRRATTRRPRPDPAGRPRG